LWRDGRAPSSDRLQRWARERRSDNAVAAHAFEAINRAFSNDALLPTLLRGPALGLAGKVAPLGGFFLRRAMGL
jgi:2-octaprenyl-3-methyl-6-methoxy-1,4-benzoquinol hydroxylase